MEQRWWISFLQRVSAEKEQLTLPPCFSFKAWRMVLEVFSLPRGDKGLM